MSGRFAPSPTGRLHVGNLRTAVLGWLAARSDGRGHLVRMEDLDRVNSSSAHEDQQLADLAALGVDWDGDVVRQSERFVRYDAAIESLTDRGLTYECFCTRREVRAEIESAAQAPHLPSDAYPGTCRELTEQQRRRHLADGRRPAIRLRAGSGTEPGSVEPVSVDDAVCGRFEAAVDDIVLRRNDGVPAYHVAVVIDDAAQEVTQVVRADDLLPSTPRQIHLQRLLGLPTPQYAHVPLVVGPDGERLAKRHGAITLGDLAEHGIRAPQVLGWIAASLAGGNGPAEPVESASELLAGFRLDAVPRSPVPVTPLLESLDPAES